MNVPEPLALDPGALGEDLRGKKEMEPILPPDDGLPNPGFNAEADSGVSNVSSLASEGGCLVSATAGTAVTAPQLCVTELRGGVECTTGGTEGEEEEEEEGSVSDNLSLDLSNIDLDGTTLNNGGWLVNQRRTLSHL